MLTADPRLAPWAAFLRRCAACQFLRLARIENLSIRGLGRFGNTGRLRALPRRVPIPMSRNYGETWGTPFLGAPLDPIRKLRQRAFGLLGQIGESCRIVYCQVGQDLAVEFYPRQL